MGRKFTAERHPGFICFTGGIILMMLFFSGCSLSRMTSASTVPMDTDLKHHLDTAQEWIHLEKFQAAADANQIFLNTNQKRYHVNDIVMDNYIKQAQIIQTLYTRILSDRALIRSLENKDKKNKNKQKKTDRTVNVLESEIKELTRKTVSLERENTALKKQIEQMKQIDLDPGYKILRDDKKKIND